MEYFLPLSVLAMIISTLSFFMIDYQSPSSSANNQSDRTPSNSSDLTPKDNLIQSEQKPDPTSATFSKKDHPVSSKRIIKSFYIPLDFLKNRLIFSIKNYRHVVNHI